MSTTTEPPQTSPLTRLIAALDDHRAGRLQAAEHGYRSVLAETAHPSALHLLGVLTLTYFNLSDLPASE